MKVLDLACGQAHVFEGWFASEEDFRAQHARGLVTCPCCGDRQIEKRLSAPRLNLGRGEAASPPCAGAAAAAPTTAAGAPSARTPVAADAAAHQAAAWRALREAVTRTEDVGERFADEARRMHHGEVARRDIRGRASPEQTLALLEEGVPVLPLPNLPGLDGPLH